jgi:hypothetical protein
MGLKAEWLTSVESLLKNEDMHAEVLSHEYFHLLFIAQGSLILNLVPLVQQFIPEDLLALQAMYQQQNIQVIHLWEDIFLTRKPQVLSRIKSILGRNIRIHGRSTTVEKISKEDADLFLNQFHLQGNVGARYRYGLVYKNEMVAVATFSNKRKMYHRGADHHSAELIRFATKDGITVTGGLSKLIKHYVKAVAPDDLMSYADRDWSLGKGYLSSGFKFIKETPPAKLYVNVNTLQRYFFHRKPAPLEGTENAPYIEIFNTGNLKYILDL